MLTVLGGLAEFERDWIRARTSEGRERAKARGVKLGLKPKLTEHQRREAIWRRDCRPHLRRIVQYDLSTDSATGQPFRRRSGYKMMR
jgi:DNA invertase Pin-like site-specific DNA recombinase